jgi:molecular chaperone GrpE
MGGRNSAEGLSSELEDALREATDAVDANRAKPRDEAGGKMTADQVTIEVLSDELGNLKTEYEARLAELEELKDRSLRQQAEFENFRRRGLKEREEAHHFGHQNLVKDLLPTVDNLERALEHAEGSDSANLEGLLQGVDLVLRELVAALRKHSVELVEAENQTFDPAVHEAVGQVADASLPPNTVAHVLQKGYQLHDRMLRPARVMVTRPPDGGDQQGSEAAHHAGGDGDKKDENA